MRIERDATGDFILDPAELAKRFGLAEAEFRRNMSLGLVKSTVEIGQAEDTGTVRLTLRCGNRIWQAVLDAEDRIVSEHMRFAHGPKGKRPPSR